jgi:hypothetical protein
MACIEYMKSFYNDHYFKAERYSQLLGDVVHMCNKMIMTTHTKNTEILNEILELYRLIVEKYASGANTVRLIVELVGFLKEIWNYFVGG